MTTGLHQLVRTGKRPYRRVGRGQSSTRGKQSGRGGKGQTARAGHKIRPALRDIIKKLPKRRGEGVSRNRFKTESDISVVLNVGVLNTEFKTGERVTPKVLLERALIEKRGNKIPAVKILATGALDKKLEVRGCAVSGGAKAAIEKLGGTVK